MLQPHPQMPLFPANPDGRYPSPERQLLHPVCCMESGVARLLALVWGISFYLPSSRPDFRAHGYSHAKGRTAFRLRCGGHGRGWRVNCFRKSPHATNHPRIDRESRLCDRLGFLILSATITPLDRAYGGAADAFGGKRFG